MAQKEAAEADKKTPNEDDEKFLTGSLLKYIESTTILSLMVASIYYIGWAYTDGFLSRIGLPHSSYELSTTQYLMSGFIAFLAVSAFSLALWMFFDHFNVVLKSRSAVIVQNFLILGVAGIILQFLYRHDKFSMREISVIIATVVVIYIIISTVLGKSLLTPEVLNRPFAKTGLLLVIYFITVVLAFTTGEDYGGKVVNGQLEKNFRINLVWKEHPIEELEGKPLIFLMHKDEKYYVSVMGGSPSFQPQVYIVPEDLIKYAVVFETGK